MANIKKLNNEQEYNEFINNPGTLNLIKGFATWCGPCKALSYTILDLTSNDVEGVILAEVDVDDEWFENYLDKLRIRGVPVIIAFKDGKEIDRVSGNMPKADLIDFITRNR